MKIDKKIITIDGFDYAVRIWGTGEVLFALHGFLKVLIPGEIFIWPATKLLLSIC